MNIVAIIRNAVGFAGLLFLGLEDIRRKELVSLQILIMGALGLVLSFLCGAWKEPGMLLSYLPGIVFLLIAYVGRECIGYGDGLVILCLGAYLSPGQIFELCMAALTLAGLVALGLMLAAHKGRRTTLPFVPFLLAGYVIVMVRKICFGG
ncbi:MAG: hypothetical protein J1D89_03610 [Agathobacter sp.]|nr:hypothetical protein [Agathobacter sp.]